MSVTLTGVYSRAHSVMWQAAGENGVGVTDMRLLVAVYEAGGEARSDDLYEALWSEGTMVRRSISALRNAGLVTTTGIDGLRSRPGIQNLVRQTFAGEKLAAEVVRLAHPLVELTEASA